MRSIRRQKEFKGLRTRFRTIFKPGVKYSTRLMIEGQKKILLVKIKKAVGDSEKESIVDTLRGCVERGYFFEGFVVKIEFPPLLN